MMTLFCILCISLCLGIVGVALLLAGQLGQTVGNVPHCRRCNYCLTGVQSARCPECGAELQDCNIRTGRHHRSFGQVALGVSCLLACLLLCVVAVRGICAEASRPPTAWEAVRDRTPTPKLLRNAEKGDWASISCLSQRGLDGTLTASQADEFYTLILKAAIKGDWDAIRILRDHLCFKGVGESWLGSISILTEVEQRLCERHEVARGFADKTEADLLADVVLRLHIRDQQNSNQLDKTCGSEVAAWLYEEHAKREVRQDGTPHRMWAEALRLAIDSGLLDSEKTMAVLEDEVSTEE